MVSRKHKILQNYPFEKLNPPVILVEGCKAYDGVIGDKPGKHKGIDFIRKKGKRKNLDPYGIYDRASSGKYPQPGESLKGLSHYFTSTNPQFAKKK